MAPEMLEDRGYYSSFDLWSLGAIIYQMLTGKLAFDGKNSTEIENKILQEISITIHVDDEFKAIINSLCHMNPYHRLVAYQTPVRSSYYYTLWKDISTLNVQPPFSMKPYIVLKVLHVTLDGTRTSEKTLLRTILLEFHLYRLFVLLSLIPLQIPTILCWALSF